MKGCGEAREGETALANIAYSVRESMKVTVHLLPVLKDTRNVELEEGATVERLIRVLDLLPDGWLAVSDGEPVPIDHVLNDGDEVRLISVVSGG